MNPTRQEHVPVFIGSFRSGTTLLINLLGLHPDVAPWFETKAFCEALRWIRVLNHPETAAFESRIIQPASPAGFDVNAVAERMNSDFTATAARIGGQQPSGKMAHERYPIGNDHVLYSLAEAQAALARWTESCSLAASGDTVAAATGELIRDLGACHARRASKPQWINKTPEIPRFAAELRQSLGACRTVFLLRDGREVFRSASQLGWARPSEIAFWWKELIVQSRLAAQPCPDDYLEMRYEDLIRDPVVTIHRLLTFLQLDPCAEQLVAAYQQRLGRDVFADPPSRSTDRLAKEDWEAFDAIAGDMMRQLGYV